MAKQILLQCWISVTATGFQMPAQKSPCSRRAWPWRLGKYLARDSCTCASLVFLVHVLLQESSQPLLPDLTCNAVQSLSLNCQSCLGFSRVLWTWSARVARVQIIVL